MAVEQSTTKVCSKCKAEKPVESFSKNSRRKDGRCVHCKSCMSASQRAWQLANHEKRAAYNRAYHIAHYDEKREMMQERVRSWTLANPERKAKASRAWYQKNKKSVIDRVSAYYEANKEKIAEYKRKWVKENHQKTRVGSANRRAKKREVGGRLSAGLADRLYNLQRGKCACCGKPLGKNFHLDHILPLALGGTNTDDNIQLLRGKCNNQKHAKHPVDFMQQRGFLL